MSTIARRFSLFIDLCFYAFDFRFLTFGFPLLLALSFAFACFAAFGFLMFFALFECEMRGRFDALFAQTLVLYLLLMLYLPLFLTALEGDDLVHREGFVCQHVFVDEECCPRIGGGITCLFGCEMGVLPVGQLLGLGDLTTETYGEDLLEAEIEDAVLGDHGLHIDAVSGLEVASASETVDVIFEGEAYFADVGVSEDVGECLGHAYMGQAEEVTAFVGCYLHECRRVVDTSLKTRTCFGVHADDFLGLEIGDSVRDLFFAVDDEHLSFECRNGHQLKQLFTDMCCLISHGVHALRR